MALFKEWECPPKERMEYTVSIVVKGRKVSSFDLTAEEAKIFAETCGMPWPASRSAVGGIEIREIQREK